MPMVWQSKAVIFPSNLYQNSLFVSPFYIFCSDRNLSFSIFMYRLPSHGIFVGNSWAIFILAYLLECNGPLTVMVRDHLNEWIYCCLSKEKYFVLQSCSLRKIIIFLTHSIEITRDTSNIQYICRPIDVVYWIEWSCLHLSALGAF